MGQGQHKDRNSPVPVTSADVATPTSQSLLGPVPKTSLPYSAMRKGRVGTAPAGGPQAQQTERVVGRGDASKRRSHPGAGAGAGAGARSDSQSGPAEPTTPPTQVSHRSGHTWVRGKGMS